MTTDTSKAPERIFAKVHGASTDVISGKRGLLGGWNEHQRDGQAEYVRRDLFDATQARAEKAEAENERLRALIREGCDLMDTNAEGFRSSYSINDQISTDPEDSDAVAAIEEMEGWIDRAGRAALERKERGDG